MCNIKFIKEPNYTYTLLLFFIGYFNKDFFLKPLPGYKHSDEDIEFLQKKLDEYSPISDELLLFFYMPQSSISFMTRYYFEPYKSMFYNGKYNLDTVLTALSDYEKVIQNVLRFYFREESEETLQECFKSLICLNKLIKESDYSGEIKSALFSFFIDPIPVIQKLSSELRAKEKLLSIQYEENYKNIAELQSKLTYERVVSEMKLNPEKAKDLSQFDEIYISVGILSRQNIVWVYHEKVAVIMIGLDYEDFLEEYMLRELPVELDTFCIAISEKNRIQILEFMLQNKEVTKKDIEKALGLTAANAYYHLSLMIRANMLRTRNQGRTVMYRINKEHMQAVSNAIGRYCK